MQTASCRTTELFGVREYIGEDVMKNEPTISIDDLIETRREGHTPPAGFYTRADIFELDLEVFFRERWIFVGVEPELAEPGDILAVDLGRDSALIVRDDDGRIGAFHNVCRHRGARLVSSARVNVGKIVCPYHQWTYELNGALVHTTNMGRDFDRSCRSLRPIHFRSIAGLLFVCLSENPPADIDEMAAVMEQRLVHFDLRNTKIAFESEIVEDGNWKLTIENNRECYHCAATHPELMNSFVASDFGFDPADLSAAESADVQRHGAAYAELLDVWEALGYPSRAFERMSGRPTIFRTQRLRIEGQGESQTIDTRVASRKLMGSIAERRLGDLHFWTHNSWHHFMSDHAVSISVIPLSAERSVVRSRWLVNKDAVEGQDYDVGNLTRVWLATNEQDAALVSRTQRGIASSAYEPGLYSPFTEAYPNEFIGWYMASLRERRMANSRASAQNKS